MNNVIIWQHVWQLMDRFLDNKLLRSYHTFKEITSISSNAVINKKKGKHIPTLFMNPDNFNSQNFKIRKTQYKKTMNVFHTTMQKSLIKYYKIDSSN